MDDLATNRKAFHNYEILETIEAGIVLVGTEVKSLRSHGGNIQDAYVVFHRREAFLKNASIAPYAFGGIHNHEDRRERKLLLHGREISRLKSVTEEKGVTLVPLSLYIKHGVVKVRLGLARGKKLYDKRAALKKREHQRSIERAVRGDE
jgi:SsrA-binding protein